MSFGAPRTAFAGCVPQELFPSEKPERDARQNAHEAKRGALGKTLGAIKSDQAARWGNRTSVSAKGPRKLAFKWMRGHATKWRGLLKRGDGKLAGNPDEMCEFLVTVGGQYLVVIPNNQSTTQAFFWPNTSMASRNW